jgi:tetratricopeptide (TPR) repeat protein
MTSLEQRLEELETLAGHSAATAKAADAPVTEETPTEVGAIGEPVVPPRVIPVAAIHIRKSETLMNLGKLNEAMEALDEAARHEGDPAEIHLARGRILEKLGRLGDALDSYDRAVSTDQTNTTALLMKAGVLNRQERFDEALNCYERALAVHRAAN